jgi:hypothetical protein
MLCTYWHEKSKWWTMITPSLNSHDNWPPLNSTFTHESFLNILLYTAHNIWCADTCARLRARTQTRKKQTQALTTHSTRKRIAHGASHIAHRTLRALPIPSDKLKGIAEMQGKNRSYLARTKQRQNPKAVDKLTTFASYRKLWGKNASKVGSKRSIDVTSTKQNVCAESAQHVSGCNNKTQQTRNVTASCTYNAYVLLHPSKLRCAKQWLHTGLREMVCLSW